MPTVTAETINVEETCRLLVRIERRKLLGVGDRHGGPYLHLTDNQRELVIAALRATLTAAKGHGS